MSDESNEPDTINNPSSSNTDKHEDTSTNTTTTNPSASNGNLNAACFRCRGFRHACDRKRPNCTRCARRGLNCTYPEAAPTLKKLQKATETLGDRIKKFSDRLKTGEGMPTISLQRLARGNTGVDSLAVEQADNNSILAHSPDTRSIHSTLSDSASEKTYTNADQDDDACSLDTDRQPRQKKKRVASTTHFSVYPCSKCFKDLQQCDLTLPKCTRCDANGFTCEYAKTEPKANHVSQVLNTMNKVMDQWQGSIDKMAKDFAQKTRDFSVKANNSLKIKPMQPFAWKITSTNKGLSVESSVSSYNDLSTLVEQFKRSMNISGKPAPNMIQRETSPYSEISESPLELDDTASITSSSFSFAMLNSWTHPTNAMPQDYPIEISQELTDNLIELFCRTPCCSAIRIPSIDAADFLARYNHPDPAQRPAKVLVYAVCSMAARNAFQLHVWSKCPAFESPPPQNDMGKALSMVYALRGRELLAECFDEPSLDFCQAACILSYSNHQNGFPGVIYVYEWIAHTMAQDLGLYSADRELSQRERMLVWNLYYYNTWNRVLQGSSSSSTSGEESQFHPKCPLPDLPVRPSADQFLAPTPTTEIISYYVQTMWVYLMQLQQLREKAMSRLVAAHDLDKADAALPQDLLALQFELDLFHEQLPPEWQNMDLGTAMQSTSTYQHQHQHQHQHQYQQNLFNMDPSSPPSLIDSSSINTSSTNTNTSSLLSGPTMNDEQQNQYTVDGPAFGQYCVLYVQVYYHINQILLYQPFFSSDRVPSSEFGIQALQVCMNACASITCILEIMAKVCGECNVPLVAFIFANNVLIKLLSYDNDTSYQEFAIFHLQKAIDISKMSSNYTYDFELARTFVGLMEQDVQQRLAHFYSTNISDINFDLDAMDINNWHTSCTPSSSSFTPQPSASPSVFSTSSPLNQIDYFLA